MCKDDTRLLANNGLLNEQWQFQMQTHPNQPNDAALKPLLDPLEGVFL